MSTMRTIAGQDGARGAETPAEAEAPSLPGDGHGPHTRCAAQESCAPAAQPGGAGAGAAAAAVAVPVPMCDDPNAVARLFDAAWYLVTYPDVAAAGVNPLEHYLRHGAAEGRDPGPLFSTRWYLEAYPDVAAAGVNPLEHYLRRGAAEGRRARSPRAGNDGRGPTPETVAEARASMREFAALEPDLVDLLALDLQALPVVPPEPEARAGGWRGLYLSLDRAPRRIVLVPSLDDDETERHLSRLLRAAHSIDDADSTMLVIVDAAVPPTAERLPPGTPWRALAEFEERLNHEDRVAIVTALIHNLRPEAVLAMGSRAAWEVIARHGAVLARRTELFGALIAPGRDGPGPEGPGLALRYLRRCLPVVSAVYADDAGWIEDVAERHGLPPAERRKLRLLPPLGSPNVRASSSGTAGEGAPSTAHDDHQQQACLRALVAEPGFLAARRPGLAWVGR
jgi:hypothetical protein